MSKLCRELAWLGVLITVCGLMACERAPQSAARATAAATDADAAPVLGGLHTITIASASPEETRDFFRVFGLAPLATPDTAQGADTQAALWGISPEIARGATVLVNPFDPLAPRIRVLAVPGDAPLVREHAAARRDGGFSVGFACAPIADGSLWLERSGGLQAVARTEVVVASLDGAGQATLTETIFHAPENLVVPCLARPADTEPLARLDAQRGVGGPAFAGIVVANIEQEIQFYRDVLGLEKRRDMVLTDSKLLASVGLPAAARLRLVQLYVPETSSGFLTLLDAGEHGERNAATRPPARGAAMWTFRVRKLLEVRRRLKAAHGVVVAGPSVAYAAEWGEYKAMTVLTPAGTFLELIEVDPN